MGGLPSRERVRAASRSRVRRRSQCRGPARRVAAVQVSSLGAATPRVCSIAWSPATSRKCRVGQVLYTPWCDAHGKVIDDGTISRLDEHTFRLTSAEPNLRWLSMNSVGLDVSIEDVSERTGALALQGPLSRTILQQLTPADLTALKYFRLVHTTVRDIRGDDLADRLHRRSRLRALGRRRARHRPLGRADRSGHAVRHHSGRHLGARSRPHRGGPRDARRRLFLGASRRDRGPEIVAVRAQPRVDRERRQGSVQRPSGVAGRKGARTRVGIRRAWTWTGSRWRRSTPSADCRRNLPTVAWRTSAPVYRDGKQIGYATSGCWSPLLKKYLALAHVVAPHFHPGAAVELEVTVEHHRKRANAVVRKLPFFDPPRKKA